MVREGTFDEVAKSESESLENWVEDYAPISHRFGAGLFDLIVGVFLSFILLLAFVILGKTFFSVEALFGIFDHDGNRNVCLSNNLYYFLRTDFGHEDFFA